jgi:3-phosphoshikimate 1-carboxyvinyltransferase
VPAGGAVEPLVADVGESGTTCRLVIPILAAGNGVFRVQGRGRMHQRPVGELGQALQGLGVDLDYLENEGYPPLRIRAAGLPGGTVSIGLDESSQYLSGLLLAGPMARNVLVVAIGGSKVVSWPYVGLTLQAMEDFGVRFEVQRKTDAGEWEAADWRDPGEVAPGRLRFRITPSMYMGREARVEGDWSNASYFLAAGAVGQNPVRVEGLRRDSLQGDRAILDILERMGAAIAWEGDAVTVSPSALSGIDVDMGASPDLVPTVAVAAALATGETRIRNVAHLRIKESDRLAAVATELNRTGARVEVLEDGLRIQPGPMPAGERIEFSAYGDHRLAMCLSLLELAEVKVRLDDPDVVAKSFPDFWKYWRKVA